MTNIKIDDKIYSVDQLDAEGKAQLAASQFLAKKLLELNSLVAALNTAKNAYIQQLKTDVISAKAGF
jgi:hypothetical protein